MKLFATLLATALLLATATQSSNAEAVAGPQPWRGCVTAQWDNVFQALGGVATFEGTARMTHMGKTLQSGTLTLVPGDDPLLIPGGGDVTIVAANGDELSFTYSGLLDVLAGVGAGEFEFTGGTGRFADAKGGGTFHATIDLSAPANQAMFVILDGEISY